MDRDIKKDPKAFFENLLNLLPYGMMLVRSNHDIGYHNKPFAGLFASEDHRFSNFSEWLNKILPESDYRRQVRNILLYEMPYTETDGKRTCCAAIPASDGRDKIIQFTSVPVGNDQFLIICGDITEERRHDIQLQQAHKMEAIGSLAGSVAHEMNNVLMGIQGYVSLMLLDTPTSDKNYSRLQAVETQIKHGSNLTRQLLERSRGGRFEFKTIEINDLISAMAFGLQQARRDIRISEKYSAYPWAVEADTKRLEKAFQEILSFAANLLPGQGTLLLKTENVMLDGSAAAGRGIKSGPFIQVSLVVSEVLLGESIRLNLFRPASVLDEANERAGSGLPFACGIIKGHEGTIEVTADEVNGTVFHVYLPASSKTPHKKRQETPAVKSWLGQETILLVDDEEVMTEVTGAILKKLGYRVLTAADGEEAVAIYSTLENSIDLVIMDVVMPGMGGGEAIDLIRSINPSVKVILCSGYSMEGAVKAIMDKGVQTFLKKPFQLDELSRTIREVLDR